MSWEIKKEAQNWGRSMSQEIKGRAGGCSRGVERQRARRSRAVSQEIGAEAGRWRDRELGEIKEAASWEIKGQSED